VGFLDKFEYNICTIFRWCFAMLLNAAKMSSSPMLPM
jgi:hypothetical protein